MPKASTRRSRRKKSTPAAEASHPPDSALDKLLDALEVSFGRPLDALTRGRLERERIGESLAKERRWKVAPLTEGEKGLVVGVTAAGGNLALAALMLGRGERWLNRQLEDHGDVKELVVMARNIRSGLVQRSLFRNAVENNNVAAQIFLAKNWCGMSDRHTIRGTIQHDVFPHLVAGSFRPEIEAQARKELAGGH